MKVKILKNYGKLKTTGKIDSYSYSLYFLYLLIDSKLLDDVFPYSVKLVQFYKKKKTMEIII